MTAKIHYKYEYEDGKKTIEVNGDKTLAVILDGFGIATQENSTVVYLDENKVAHIVDPKFYSYLKPKAGEYYVLDRLTGDNPLATILTVAALAFGQFQLAPMLQGLGAAAQFVGMAAYTLGTQFLIQAIAPYDAPKVAAGVSESATADINGTSNQIRNGSPFPYIIGRNKVVPPLASQPLKTARGDLVNFKQIFVLGHAPLKTYPDTILIGDNPLTNFSDYQMQIYDGHENYNPIDLIQGKTTNQSNISATLLYEDEYIITGGIDAERAEIVFSFNSGLVSINKTGEYVNTACSFTIDYRLVGDTDWTPHIATETYRVKAVKNPETLTYNHRVDKDTYENRTKTFTKSYFEFLDGIPDLDIVVGSRIRIFNSNKNNGIYEVFEIEGNKAYVGYFEKGALSNYNQYGKSLQNETKELLINSSGAYGAVDSTTFTFIDATTQATYRTVYIPALEKGQYEFRIVRKTPDSDSNRLLNESTLVNLATTQMTDDNGAPLDVLEDNMAYLALDITATDQLNGTISELSMEVQSVPHTYDPNTEIFTLDEDASGNNAWEYLTVLKHDHAAKEPLLASDIDLDTIVEWAEICDEDVNGSPRHRINHVVDYSGLQEDLMRRIASMGRASSTFKDNKYSLFLDIPNKPAIQKFTPMNSWGFSAEKSFDIRPDAFSCKWINPDKDWATTYTVVKSDDELADEDISVTEELDCIGITDPDRLYRYAKHAHAQLELRPEEYSLTTGIESLVCSRGDAVIVAHDKIQGDVQFGRVLDFTDSSITLNNEAYLESGVQYYVTFRSNEEEQYTNVYEVNGQMGNTYNIEFNGTAPTYLEESNIAIIGSVVENINRKYLVKEVTRSSSLTADLTLVDYADPEIYDAEDGVIPDYEVGFSKIANRKIAAPLAPELIQVYSDERALRLNADGSLTTRIALQISIPDDDTRPSPEYVYIAYRPSGTDGVFRVQSPQRLSGGLYYADDVIELLEYDIRVWVVADNNVKSQNLEIFNHLVTGKTNNPSDVETFTYSYNKGTYTLAWEEVGDLDVKSYVLYKDGVEFARVSGNNYDATNINNGSNTYGIRAVDTTGHLSDNIKTLIFSVSMSPPNVSVIDSGTDYLIKNDDGTINTRIYVEWDQVEGASFYEIQYRLSTDSNYDSYAIADTKTFIETAKANATYYIQIRAIGQTEAVYSEWTTLTHVVTGKSELPSDVQNASITLEDRNLIINWGAISDADASSYEIRKGTSWNSAVFVANVDTTSWSRPADVTGTHTWLIKAIDTSDLRSANAKAASITIVQPQEPTVSAQVIDNNVLLKFKSEQGTLPIEYYEIERDGEIVGSVNGNFSTVFESSSGTYTYNITPIDIAGNRGDVGSFATTVSQPPDYVLNAEFNSDLSGTKVNAVESNGYLIMLVDAGETWGDYLASTTEYANLAEEVAAGYTNWLTPTNNATATYQETYDYGAVLAASLITITPAIYRKVGTPTITPMIEISEDNVTWTAYNGVTSVYATQFRYVRFTLTVVPDDDNDQVIYKEIEFKLDSKLKSDSLKGVAYASDTNGTVFNFNVSFIDVQSVVLTPRTGSNARFAIADFVDTPYPTSFKVLMYDEDGNRVDGEFSAAIRGY